jgi:hypothetical protein
MSKPNHQAKHQTPKYDDARRKQRQRMGLADATAAAPIRVENDKFVFSVDALAHSKARRLRA